MTQSEYNRRYKEIQEWYTSTLGLLDGGADHACCMDPMVLWRYEEMKAAEKACAEAPSAENRRERSRASRAYYEALEEAQSRLAEHYEERLEELNREAVGVAVRATA